MATQIFTFRITYADCNGKIWRTVAVSSNDTLAKLGYLVLATFDTMAYHLFEMKYKDTTYFLSEEELELLPFDEMPFEGTEFGGMKNIGLLGQRKLGRLEMCVGDVIEMTYDMGCGQVFEITLLEIGEFSKKDYRSYPKILDGAGRGIVDDMPAAELAEAIRKIDLGGHSEIYYSSNDLEKAPEWDYRDYDIRLDNMRLRSKIRQICAEYEDYEEEDI